MIDLCGNHGYQATTVEAICGFAGASHSEFSRRFADKEDCYVAAYDETAAEFGDRVFTAYDSHNVWHDSMWAASWAALRYVQEDPARARFFVVEVDAVGPRARSRHDGVMQTMANLVDAGRSELEDRASISRATAEVVAGAVHSTMRQKIVEGSLDREEDFLVELLYLAVFPYLGVEVAEAELSVQPLR